MRLEPLDQMVSSSSRSVFHLPRSKGSRNLQDLRCPTPNLVEHRDLWHMILQYKNAFFWSNKKMGAVQENSFSYWLSFSRKPNGINCATVSSNRPVYTYMIIHAHTGHNPFPQCRSQKNHEGGFTETEGNPTWLASLGMLIHPSHRLCAISHDFTWNIFLWHLARKRLLKLLLQRKEQGNKRSQWFDILNMSRIHELFFTQISQRKVAALQNLVLVCFNPGPFKAKLLATPLQTRSILPEGGVFFKISGPAKKYGVSSPTMLPFQNWRGFLTIARIPRSHRAAGPTKTEATTQDVQTMLCRSKQASSSLVLSARVNIDYYREIIRT